MGPPQQRPRDGQALALAARDLDSALADHGVQAARRPRQQRLAGGLAEHLEDLVVCCVRTHEEQVLADGPGEELGVLRDQAQALAQPVEVDDVLGMAVVEDLPGLRMIQTDQELDQRGLARAGWADEGDGLAAPDGEGHVLERGAGRGQMGEAHRLEPEVAQRVDDHRMLGALLRRDGQDGLVLREARLRLPEDGDHVPHLLERPEDEERIDPEREELADGDPLRVDEVQHQAEDRGAQGVHGGALDEAEAAEVADLAQLQGQDLVRGGVEPAHLLGGEAEALDQLDVPQRLRGGAGQGRRLLHDRGLHGLDLLAEGRAEQGEGRDAEEVGGGDDPVHAQGVHGDEDDADQGREQDVDGGLDQPLDVRAHLLQLAQRLPAALVLEDLVGNGQGVADPVRVELGPQALRDHADEVVLEVLGQEQEPGAAQERPRGVLAEAHRVAVDDVAEDERIEQREDLVHRGQDQGQRDEPPVLPQVGPEQLHRGQGTKSWSAVVEVGVAFPWAMASKNVCEISRYPASFGCTWSEKSLVRSPWPRNDFSTSTRKAPCSRAIGRTRLFTSATHLFRLSGFRAGFAGGMVARKGRLRNAFTACTIKRRLSTVWQLGLSWHSGAFQSLVP